jgi:2-haloacid dehalogenase
LVACELGGLFVNSKKSVVTFDFYGTLVQWHEGLHHFVSAALESKGQPASAIDSLLHDFHVKGRALRDAPAYSPYRSILSASMVWAFGRKGCDFTKDDEDGLIEAIRGLKVFPEARAVLSRLKAAGLRLALISNSDDDIIMPCAAASGLPLDMVITAQQAEAYKPNPRHFTYAHERLGVAASDVKHVAASMQLDMAVCKVLSIDAIWVNRRNEKADNAYRPYEEVRDLVEAERHIVLA